MGFPRNLGFTVVLAILVAGCGGGSSGGGSSAGAAAPVVQSNLPPVISGQPPTSVAQGSPYDFTPVASDPDGDALVFSADQLPAWATFDPANGRVSGTPGANDVGTYGNLSISVSDGSASVSLQPFTLTVEAVLSNSVTLQWTPPTTYDDGSTLGDLSAYGVYWGPAGSIFTDSIRINNVAINTYVVENLMPGNYQFTVLTFNSLGVASDPSNFVEVSVQ